MRKSDIMVVTGPTGGHFFPGLAIAETLAAKTCCSVKLVVPERSLIRFWLAKENLRFSIIPEARFTGWNFPLFFLRFVRAFAESFIIILTESPSIVVGTGSYATVPFLLAAWTCGVKIMLHEQNFTPGRVTRLFASLSRRIALTFPNMNGLPRHKCVVTGFPLPREQTRRVPRDEALKAFGLTATGTTVLVIGGSQGASFVNAAVTAMLPGLRDNDIQFIHLAGPEHVAVADVYRRNGIRAAVEKFCYDMGAAYSAADFVIARAGAGTVAEVQERLLPAVFIPYPHAAGHQRENARFIERTGAAVVYEQSRGVENLLSVFLPVLKAREEMRGRSAALAVADTGGKTVSLLLSLIPHESRIS